MIRIKLTDFLLAISAQPLSPVVAVEPESAAERVERVLQFAVREAKKQQRAQQEESECH